MVAAIDAKRVDFDCITKQPSIQDKANSPTKNVNKSEAE